MKGITNNGCFTVVGGKIKITVTHTLFFSIFFQCNGYLALTKRIKEEKKEKKS